ncbi:hypothetical protein, partial [Cronobacter malonaticus]|uniref:hypothetical protein n=1 Tax=Cronobacter malonaticus TaxID=413503 RepID=UPI00157A5257
HLIADIADHLHGLQAILFFLFVKDRAGDVVSLRYIPLQSAGILRVRLIANGDRACRNRRQGGTLCDAGIALTTP